MALFRGAIRLLIRLGCMAGLDWDDIWGLLNNYLGSRLDMRPYYAWCAMVNRRIKGIQGDVSG